MKRGEKTGNDGMATISISIAVLMLICATAPVSSNDAFTVPQCLFEKWCYTAVSTGDWHGAKNMCVNLGGFLANISSEAEAQVVADVCDRSVASTPRNRYCWLGYTDEAEEGKWKNMDGTVAGFLPWNRLEPNNHAGREHYAIILPRDQPALGLHKGELGDTKSRNWWDTFVGICKINSAHTTTTTTSTATSMNTITEEQCSIDIARAVLGNITKVEKRWQIDTNNAVLGNLTEADKQWQMDMDKAVVGNITSVEKRCQIDTNNAVLGNLTEKEKQWQMEITEAVAGNVTKAQKRCQIDTNNAVLGNLTEKEKQCEMDIDMAVVGNITRVEKQCVGKTCTNVFMKIPLFEAWVSDLAFIVAVGCLTLVPLTYILAVKRPEALLKARRPSSIPVSNQKASKSIIGAISCAICRSISASAKVSPLGKLYAFPVCTTRGLECWLTIEVKNFKALCMCIAAGVGGSWSSFAVGSQVCLTECLQSMLQAAGAADRFALRSDDGNSNALKWFQTQLRVTSFLSGEAAWRIVFQFWLCIKDFWEDFQNEHNKRFRRGVPRLYYAVKPKLTSSSDSAPEHDGDDAKEGAEFYAPDGKGWLSRWENVAFNTCNTFIHLSLAEEPDSRPQSAPAVIGHSESLGSIAIDPESARHNQMCL